MGDQVILGCEYNWWRGDPLPDLAPLDGFRAEVIDDISLLARLQENDPGEMLKRQQEGNHCMVAFLQEEPVGYGWIATEVVRIIEVGWTWYLTPQDRHLWDFATLPDYRGLGVYPHLLQAILRSDEQSAKHFWIGHRGDNIASQRGILKAGFKLHWLFVLTPEGKFAQPQGDMARVTADPRWSFIENLLDNATVPSLEQNEDRRHGHGDPL